MNAPTHIPTDAKPSGIADKSIDSFRCAAVIEVAVESYRAALMLHLHEKGGPLDVDDLAHVARRIIGVPGHPSPFAETVVGAFRNAVKKTDYEARRTDPFGRLIIHTFSHLLVKDGTLGNDGTGISRSHLPRFFELLRVMLGDDTIDARRILCEKIVEDLKAARPAEFSWNLFYADPRAREVLARTVLDLVEHFRNFDRRVDWFIRFMNSHPLGRAKPANGGYADFTRSDFFTVARALIRAVEHDLCPVAYENGSDGTTVLRFRDLVESPIRH